MKKFNFELFIVSFVNILIISHEKLNESFRDFTVLKYDSEFIKPKIKLTSEFELIKLANGMKGLLIHDPFTTYSHVHFNSENGSITDSSPAISHLHEHMALSCSKNYNQSYHILRNFGGINGYSGGATSGFTSQEYFYTLPFNFRFEKGLKMITDSLINPIYSPQHIKKEIQAINAEFFLNYDNEMHLLDTILRSFANNESSLSLMATGDNITLSPNEGDLLSKKLKSYFNVFIRPENFFFILYSSMTLEEMEKLSVKYLNYEMNEFPEDEIDIIEKNNFINNIKKIEKQELFKEELFLHGIYFNSHTSKNKLSLSLYITGIDIKKLKYDIFDYFSYLFQSESLLNILKKNKYIVSIHDISTALLISIQDKHVFEILLELTDEGINNIEEVLLILYSYIDIIKKEGHKKKFFYNFIQYKKNSNIKSFNKEMFTLLTTFSNFIENYRYYGQDHILDKGTPFYADYNEKKMRKLLQKININKSYFILNSPKKLKKLKTFLYPYELQKLKYFNKSILYGEYPPEFKEKIINNNDNNIKDLFIRKINPYFSIKEDNVIPCYNNKDNSINKCKLNHEFDYENDDKYEGVLIQENKYFKTLYQKDKSSESFYIKANLDIHFDENKNLSNDIIEIIKFYLNDKFSIINEADTISIVRFDQSSIGFNLVTFEDNSEIIYQDFLRMLKEIPNEDEFEYAKMSYMANKKENENVQFHEYIIKLLNIFISGGNGNTNNNNDKNNLDDVDYDDVITIYKEMFNSIVSIDFKIAGNFEVELVNKIHNMIKNHININIIRLNSCDGTDEENNIGNNINKGNNTNEENNNDNNNDGNSQNNNNKEYNYIVDYYQKSEMDRELDGAIFVIYRFKPELNDYMLILKSCMDAITRVNLRLEKMHSYHPKIYVENNFFMIFEQGRYKEPTIMEKEIDKLLYDLIQGKITCQNYEDIVTSFKIKEEEIIEKNPANLFNEFVSGKFTNDENYNTYLETDFPDNFKEFMEHISSVFTEPKRYTLLIFRSDIKDDEYNEIIRNKKEKNVYILNKNMKIYNTDNISILRPNY